MIEWKVQLRISQSFGIIIHSWVLQVVEKYVVVGFGSVRWRRQSGLLGLNEGAGSNQWK